MGLKIGSMALGGHDHVHIIGTKPTSILICWLGCGLAVDLWKFITTDQGLVHSAFYMALPKNPQNDMSHVIDPTRAKKNGEFLLEFFYFISNYRKQKNCSLMDAPTVSWNTLIAGCAQNGLVDEALELFEIMPDRNVVSWNAMIAGFTQNGYYHEKLKIGRAHV